MRPVLAQFVLEARRRGLLKVATAYLIVTWLVLEIGHTLFLIFDLPHGALQFIFVLLALGFPMMLVAVWHGWLGVSASPTEAPPGEAHASAPHEGPWLAVVFGAVALFVIAVAIGVRFFGMGSSGSSHVTDSQAATSHQVATTPATAPAVIPPAFNPPAHSIAVLPFVNMSGDPQQEYFSDGMAEELLDSLVRISELKVAARTSAFSFKDKDMEVGDIARKLIDRALALDPQLVSAYVARATIERRYDLDWAAAEVSLKRARELEPNNVAVLRVAAVLAETLGRFDESIALYRQAHERDPLQSGGHVDLGRVLLATGKPVAAEASLRKGLEINPEFPGAHALIASTHLYRKEPDKALAEVQLESNRMLRLVGLARIYHALHRKTESDAALRELTEKHASDAPFWIAVVHADRGEIDEALRWLDQAYRNRDASLTTLPSNLSLRRLAHDPRYQAFLRKLNLPTDVG